MTTSTLLLDAEILRCTDNINLSVKNWEDVKAEQPSIEDGIIVTALAAHALSMAREDLVPTPEFLALHLAVAIKMLYEERKRK